MPSAAREWQRAKAREAYNGWCVTKAAQQVLLSEHNLQLLTAELHNQEVTKVVSEKSLAELPDFALVELSESTGVLSTLENSIDVIPIEVLAPSARMVKLAGLNWFHVISYTQGLLRRCFWQPSTLPPSNWSLHYNTLTPLVYPQCKAMMAFIVNHFQPFSTRCKLPPPPSYLLSTPTFVSQRKSASSLPMMPGSQAAVPSRQGTPAANVHYLMASSAELTVVWYNSFLPTLKWDSSATPLPTDPITGLFALNLKALKTHPPNNLSSTETEVHVVTTSASALRELYSQWQGLAKAAKAHLEAKGIVRPVSRSPSRQKTMSEKSQKTPPELQVSLFCMI